MRGICWYLEPWPNCSKPSFRVCYWKGPVNSRTAFHLDFHDENLSNVPHGHREGRVCWALQGGAGLKWHGAFGLKCFGYPDLGLLCFLFCTCHHLSSLVNVRLSPALGSAQNWIVPRPGHPRSHGAASWAVLQVLQDHAPPNATAWRMFVTPWSVPRWPARVIQSTNQISLKWRIWMI